MAVDLLSGIAALATVVAILFSLWYPEMQVAYRTKADANKAVRVTQAAALHDVMVTKSLPLSIAALIPVLVFAEPFVGVLMVAIDELRREGISASRYDPIATAFGGSYVLTCLLALVALGLTWRVWRTENALIA